MKEIKKLGNLKKIAIKILKSDLPLATIFDNYNLTEEQIDFLYDFTNSLYKDDDKDNNKEFMDIFNVSDKLREYKNKKLDFLFLYLQEFRSKNLTDKENKVKEEIIIRFAPIISDCIDSFFRNIDLPKEDTLMFGMHSLLDAINNYKPNCNSSFKKFAIENIILGIKNNFKLLKGIDFKEYIKSLNGEPFIDIVDVDIIDTIEEMPITFDDYEQIDINEDKKLGVFGIEYETEKVQDHMEMQKIINECIEKKLNSFRDKDIIIKSFGLNGRDEKSLTELSEEYRLSYTRIRQLHHSALSTLRRRAWILKKTYPEFTCQYYYRENIKVDVYPKILSLLGAQVIDPESVLTFLKMDGIELSEKELILIIKKIRAVCEIASKNSDVQKVLSEIKYRNFHYYQPRCYEFENREDLIKYICEHYGVLSSATYNFLDIISMSEQEKRKYIKR